MIYELFKEENDSFLESIDTGVKQIPSRLKLQIKGVAASIKLRKAAQLLKDQQLIPSVRDTYIQFGNQCYENLFKTKNEIIAKTYSLFEVEHFYQTNQELKTEILALIEDLRHLMDNQSVLFQNLTGQWRQELLEANRHFCNELTTIAQQPDFTAQLKILEQQQNKKTRKRYFEELLVFPTNWSRNQEIIHTSMETSFKLGRVNLLVTKGLGSLNYLLQEEVNQRVEAQFATHVAKIKTLIQAFNKGDTVPSLDHFPIDETAFVGIGLLMQQLKDQTRAVPDIIREDAVLMSLELKDNFETLQLEAVAPITLDLPKIVDFILESKLNGLAQNHLERYLGEVSTLYFNQINRINLLQYSLSESKEETELHQLLERVQAKLVEESELFKTIRLRFNESIRTIEYNLQMELDTRYLVEHADNWSRYISVSKRKEGIAQINERVKTKLSHWYQGVISTLSAKRQ